jgi:LysR family transcriptional regulator, carnitine catabolism transcriptional activator
MNSYVDPINLTVRHLQMLVAAADLGSFSRAAEQIGISQPAFSEAIRRIEEELGVRLFNRTTRRLELTEDGRRIIATARDLVREFKLAVETIRADAARRGRISVVALPSIVAAVMPAALTQFAARFPEVDVAIHDVQQERAVAMVHDGLADIGVGTPMGTRGRLHFSEIGPDPFLAVLPPGHALVEKAEVSWQEIAACPFIALTGLSSIRQVTDAAFINADAAPNHRCEVEQILSAVALVEASYGVTVLPAIACGMFRSRNVIVRPIADPAGQRRIGIIKLANRRLSPAGLAMAETLKSCFREVLEQTL